MQEHPRDHAGRGRPGTPPSSARARSSTHRRCSLPAPPEEPEDFERQLARLAPRAWVTPLIVVANALVYALMVASGVDPLDPDVDDLIAWGASWGPAIADGQAWRVLSAGFVHVGALHIALNMWCLWDAGRLVERIFGAGAYLGIYIASLVGGSLASLAWEPGVVAAGASGAVFGVVGSLLAACTAQRGSLQRAALREHWKSASVFVAYNLFIGATNPTIDNSAHLGGLVTGAVAGWCLARPVLAGSFGPRARLRRMPALAVLLSILGGLAYESLGDPAGGPGQASYAQAYAAFEAGELERAESLATQAIDEAPTEGAGYFLRGLIRGESGDCAGATGDFRRAILQGGGASFVRAARASLAIALSRCGHPREAEAVASEGLALDPGDAGIAETRAWIRLGLEDWSGVIEDATRAIGLDPDRSSSYWLRAQALRALNAPGALADLSRAVELEDDSELRESLQVELAFTLEEAGDLDEAEAALAELPNAELDADLLELRATLREERGDLDGAFSDANRAIELDPGGAGSHHVRGRVHLARGDASSAVRDLNRAIELSGDPALAGSARFALAYALEQEGDLSSSRAVVQELLALYPERAELRTLHAWLCCRLGDAETALADATRAIELDPGDGWNHYVRGLARSQSGDLRGAADDLARSIRFGLDAETASDARAMLVQVLASAGDHRAAVEAASGLVEHEPAAPEPLLMRARSRLLLRDLEAALEDCDRALELDPSSGPGLFLRCLVDFARGDYAAAATDAERALESSLPDRHAANAAILWACRTRAGERVEADRRLRRLGTAPEGAPWAELTSFLRGELDEETLLASAAGHGQDDPEGAPNRLATALFYAALRRWSDDDIAAALELYRRAEAAASLDWEWTTAVQLELDRLER